MTAKLNREQLLNALEQVRPGLANREMIEQSTHFAFQNGRVITFNDEISVSYPVPDLDVEGAIQADPLYQLLKKLDREEVKVKASESKLTVSAGRSRAEFKLQQEIQLPVEEVGEIGEWQPIEDPDGFLRALRFAYRSCSKDMSRPVLTCVHAAGGRIESTDNYRVTRFVTAELPTEPFLIPASSVKELLRYSVQEIADGRNWIHFRAGDGAVISCRVFEEVDKFPNMGPILETDGRKLDLSGVSEEALDRALIFAEREYELDEEVAVRLGDGKMAINSEGDAGSYKETTNIDYSDEPVSFLINPNLLRDILQHTDEAELDSNRLKFEGDDWEHVIALRMEQ